MPHVIVKMLVGRTEEQKMRLAEAITKVVMNITGNEESAVSVSVEDIKPDEWTDKVYKPDIINNWDQLYKRPGYDPLS